MASKRINTFYGKNSTGFLNLGSDIRIKDFIKALKGLMLTESIPELYCLQIESIIFNCVHSFISHYERLDSDQSREEFRVASKRHQRTLNSVLTYIVQSFKTEGYSTNILLNNDTLTVKVNSITVMTQGITPRSFRSWYKALKIFYHVGRGLTVENAIVITRVLTSVYNLVNEPELRPSEKDRMNSEMIDKISSLSSWSTIDDFKVANSSLDPLIHQGIEELKETISVIKHFSLNTSLRPPKWAEDIVRSLRLLYRDQRLFIYDNTHPVLSSNSSCSSFKTHGRTVTIPGLFASCVEPDYFKDIFPQSNFDSIVQFKQDYLISSDFAKSINAKSKRRFSVSIKQKKPKPRIIHPLNNSEQDRLGYYHNLIARVLRNVSSDCTFNQKKGPEHIKYVMDKKDQWSIYSLDLTSATDTFSIGLQWLIIKDLIFGKNEHALDLANTWLEMMTSESYINIGGNERTFSFSNGQPQGFLSSFPSFSLEHHIVMLTTLRLFDPNLDPKDFYRVLGDDSLITCEDRETEIPALYQRLMHSANVECNLSKGYLYNPHNPEMKVKLAEFAKYLILDGTELTPIPTKLLVADEEFSNYIGLAAWYSDHRSEQWSVENLKFFLMTMDKLSCSYFSTVMDTMVQLNIPSIFTRSFKRKFGRLSAGHTYLDVSITQCLLAHSIIFAACNRLIGSKEMPNSIETLLKLTKELRPFIDVIDDPSIISRQNKLWTLKEEVVRTFQTFSEVCRDYTSLDDLSEDDIMLICMIMQTNNSDVIKDKLNLVFDSLDLLLMDPRIDMTLRDPEDVMNRMLELFNNFNISIERSWSTYSKRIPVDFLRSSLVGLEEMLREKHSTSLEEFVEQNELNIIPGPVDIGTTKVANIGIDLDSTFLEYQDEDWELVL